ncbi:MAG: GNAT family N-acetyltransferase [Anaerolineae bacterium]|nr:GNAT family N-acetyltransferase [Anaerolineae bacterium]
MKTQVLHDASGFEQLHAEWNALLERSPLRTVFLTWEWQATWWKHLGEGELHLLTLRDDDGTLVGIAPLCRVTSPAGLHTFRWVGCVDVSDYLDVVAAPGYEAALYTAILDYLTSPDAPAWRYVDLCNIREASPTHQSIARMAQERGLYARASVQEVCPVIPLPATWDEYLDSLDKKQRHEIRRKIRRIESAADTRWRIADDPATLDEDIEAFIRLHRKSNPEKDAFMDEKMVAFFRDVCHTFFHCGWLSLAFIFVNGNRAASMLNFDYDNRILVYNSGYDPEEYAAMSPGIVLLSYCIRHAIETRREQFDFLRGDEEYKFRFGAVRTTVHNVLVSPEPLEP